MFIKNKLNLLSVTIGLFVLIFLAGCISSSIDKNKIIQIAENIEKALEKKKIDLFMENISYNYSDSNGGTYDNHINGLPEKIFSNIEENEDLVDGIFSIFKIEPKVTIPESDLVIVNIYASGKMEIRITLKACIAWVICTNLYNETTEYNVDFIKEVDEWKIISMMEI